MDAYIKTMTSLKNPSSKMAFGEWSLEKTSGEDRIPATVFFNPPSPSERQTALLVEAHRRLLPRTARHVLNLIDTPYSSSERSQRDAILSTLAEERPESRIHSYGLSCLDAAPSLPFRDDRFDAVVLNCHVGILDRPIEFFREVGRVVNAGGIYIVGFIHPYHAKNQTRMWALGDDRDHIVLVDSFFEYSNAFTRADTVTLFRQDGRLDWNRLGTVPDSSIRDYVHVAWAHKVRVPPDHKPFPNRMTGKPVRKEDMTFDANQRPICPHCGRTMSKMAPPVTVFEIDYGVSELFVCFENDCDYYRRSKTWMRAQGQPGYSYRFMLNPENGAIGPIPDNLAGGLATSRIE